MSLFVLIAVVPVQAAQVEIGKLLLDFSGDLRLRSEYIDNARFDRDEYRWRQRFRLRFGVASDLTEHTTVGFRFATGAKTYQTTSNQSFDGENFADFDFPIDRAFIRYKRAMGPSEMAIHLGKFGHPFYTPTEVLWDGDLQPAGAAEVIVLRRIITIAAAQYVIREQDTGKGKGSNVYAGQVAVKGDLGAIANGTLGVAYYAISDPASLRKDAFVSDSDFLTNKNFTSCTGSPPTCTGEISDFKLLNISGELSFKAFPTPIKAIGEYVNNLGAEDVPVGGNRLGEEETAWLVAAYLGKAKEKGDWRIGAGYTQIQADAVVANFNSDDLQQTNVNTVFTEFRYQVHSRIYVFYDGYYQKRNNFDLAKANANAAADHTWQNRHRINLAVEF
jgi:hypothetical protein